MGEIKVMVKPVFEVVSDGCFDTKELSERVTVEYCYSCGSPLMYIREEKDYEGKQGLTDYTWYCAVCGVIQKGIMIDDTILHSVSEELRK